ncbi:ABC transporter permease [Streptomyces sp. CA-249302]|uniref:ABC transporter permease n=1 Tax=Streptomyces sp. CA-249302 TaxID=3240058 RepID=UPI003D928EA1
MSGGEGREAEGETGALRAGDADSASTGGRGPTEQAPSADAEERLSPVPPAPSSSGGPSSPPHHLLLRLLVLLLALGVWQLAAQAHSSVYFPPPSRIAHRAYELWFSGSVRHLFLTSAAFEDVLPSLGRMAAGFGIAAVGGIAAGVVVGRSRWAYAVCNPVLQFARAVPPPALVPVFVVVLDFGTPMQIASIAFSAVWPVLINTAEGVRNTDPLRIDVAAVLRLGPFERLRFLLLPSALPRIFAGLRLSLSLALILMVFSELLPGTAGGIGFTLTDAQSRSDLLTVWAVLLLLGVLGYLLNTALLAVERRLIGRGRTTP